MSGEQPFIVDDQGRITDSGRRGYWQRFSSWIFLVALATLVVRSLFPASCYGPFIGAYTYTIPAICCLLFVLMWRDIRADVALYRHASRLDITVPTATLDALFGPAPTDVTKAERIAAATPLFMNSSSGRRTAAIKYGLIRWSATNFVFLTCLILTATTLGFSYLAQSRCILEAKSWCRTLRTPTVGSFGSLATVICGGTDYPSIKFFRNRKAETKDTAP
jgi:hypothetical protein